MMTYLKGIALLALISGLWLLVQRSWRRHFPDSADPDPLANRSGCGSCNCLPAERCDSKLKPTETEAP